MKQMHSASTLTSILLSSTPVAALPKTAVTTVAVRLSEDFTLKGDSMLKHCNGGLSANEIALAPTRTDASNVTALFDGADNCWQIVDGLTPLCASITRILYWFHLSINLN